MNQQGWEMGMLWMKIQAFQKSIDQELIAKWNDIYEKITWVSHKECLNEVKKLHERKFNKDNKGKKKELSKLNMDAVNIEANQLFWSRVIKYLNDNKLNVWRHEDKDTEEIVYVVSKIEKEYRFKVETTTKAKTGEVKEVEVK